MMYEIKFALVSGYTENYYYYFIVRNIDSNLLYYCVVDNIPRKRLTELYIYKLLILEYLKIVFSTRSRNDLLSLESIISYTI